ncbi:11342_t:CDS:1 [Acaulospora morrowiae]|uniref:11342_t:CDS:1 n=1 Tax=Acaulospora morrowiae TaxID=94023 RepID=A0A9N9CDS9_9GLOM|nr:11342_t:CDS:1 [Acaulospora morrowiae]
MVFIREKLQHKITSHSDGNITITFSYGFVSHPYPLNLNEIKFPKQKKRRLNYFMIFRIFLQKSIKHLLSKIHVKADSRVVSGIASGILNDVDKVDCKFKERLRARIKNFYDNNPSFNFKECNPKPKDKKKTASPLATSIWDTPFNNDVNSGGFIGAFDSNSSIDSIESNDFVGPFDFSDTIDTINTFNSNANIHHPYLNGSTNDLIDQTYSISAPNRFPNFIHQNGVIYLVDAPNYNQHGFINIFDLNLNYESGALTHLSNFNLPSDLNTENFGTFNYNIL